MRKILILNDTRSELHHGCETVMRNLISLLNTTTQCEISTIYTGKKISLNEKKLILDANIVIINGEGTFHDNAPYGLELLESAIFAKKNQKKVFLINATWTNNSLLVSKKLNFLDGIWLRDTASLVELKNIGINNLNYAPDLTFFTQHSSERGFIEKEYDICYTDSVFSQISDELVKYKNKQSHSIYLPIIRPLPNNYQDPLYNEKKLKKLKIYTSLKKITLGVFTPRRYYSDLTIAIDSSFDYFKKLSTSKVVIAARYHALCFCLQMKIPFLCLESNTKKTFNLLNDIGLENDHHININDLKEMNYTQIEYKSRFTENDIRKINDFNNMAKIAIHRMINSIIE